MERKQGRPALTAAAWMDRLGRRLARYFSGQQAVEMLTDYADHFSLGLERGESEATLVQSIGTPEAAADALVQENWPLRTDRWRYLWWGLLAVAVWLHLGVFSAFHGGGFGMDAHLAVLPALLTGPLSLFCCLRGRTRAEIEGAYSHKRPLPLAYGLPAAAAAGAAVIALYWFSLEAKGLLYAYDPQGFLFVLPKGEALAIALTLLWYLMALLLIWHLYRSAAVSIRYFPCAVYTAGTMMCMALLSNAMGDAKLYPDSARRGALLCFLLYLIVAAVTIGSGLYIRRCMERGAAWTRS